ncbi:hypothetical protein ACCS96_43520, partial [Rhizobium ruizarguesonis]
MLRKIGSIFWRASSILTAERGACFVMERWYEFSTRENRADRKIIADFPHKSWLYAVDDIDRTILSMLQENADIPGKVIA